MIVTMDETRDAAALSWVESANPLETDFPLRNLRLGVFRIEANLVPRMGVRTGAGINTTRRRTEWKW
jgi:fumarylacetoacetase